MEDNIRKAFSAGPEVPSATATRWFVPVRIISYVLILLFGMHVAFHTVLLLSLFVVYSFATLALAATLLIPTTPMHVGRIIRIIQFMMELAVLGGITINVPVLDPRLPVVFLFTIVSGALCFRLIGTLVLATGSSLVMIIGSLGQLILAGPGGLPISLASLLNEVSDATYFGLFLQILTFYCVAFIAGYLAEKLNVLRHEHDRVSRALSRVRLETDEILHHLNSGIISVTADGRIAQLNRAAERLLGVQVQQVQGEMLEVALATRFSSFINAIQSVIAEDIERHRFEVEIVSNHEHPIPLGISTSILRNEDSSIRGVIVIFSDLTEAKALENRVRSADRLAAVGELSASIAHEIRNPLAAISGSVEVLAGELKLSGDNQRLMELIVDESERLTRILNEFLSYARIDNPRWGRVNLGRLIDDVVTLTQRHPSFRASTEMKVVDEAKGLFVRTDEQLLKQLLLNLTLNAVEAPDVSCITLTSGIDSSTDQSIILRIHNSGRGIDPEVQERMFEPFFSTKEGGTGLGLAIVHRLASSLEIPMSVQSSDETGTSFVLQLKRAPVPAVVSQPEVAGRQLQTSI